MYVKAVMIGVPVCVCQGCDDWGTCVCVKEEEERKRAEREEDVERQRDSVQLSTVSQSVDNCDEMDVSSVTDSTQVLYSKY